MFDRAATSLIVMAAACAATALALFAAGFGLYALLEPLVGAPGAAGLVALAASMLVALIGLATVLSRRARAREAERASQELQGAIAAQLSAFVTDRPLLLTGVSLVGGVLAARYPSIARDLLALAAAFTADRR